MSSGHPGRDTLHAALALAVRAPSVHNTQPWLWRIGERSLHLYADTTRQLPCTDPDHRDLLVSCGAALHHLCVVARASGWATTVHRLPDPADPDHLASVEFRACVPTEDAVRMAGAITHRRSDRRRYTSWEVPESTIATITAAAAASGVLVHDVTTGVARADLTRAFQHAAAAHASDSAYNAELAYWSGRHAAPAGVPARNAVIPTDITARPFASPALAQTVFRDIDAVDRTLVLVTAGDDRLSRLRAGEAASAVLLTATDLGLATCPLSEPLEVPEARHAIRTDVLADSGFPQLIIRMGWAATSFDAPPATPRRPLDDVVAPLGTPTAVEG